MRRLPWLALFVLACGSETTLDTREHHVPVSNDQVVTGDDDAPAADVDDDDSGRPHLPDLGDGPEDTEPAEDSGDDPVPEADGDDDLDDADNDLEEPADDPPLSDAPPVEDPPAEDPPVEEPPVEEPPVEEPPVEDPPVEDPAAGGGCACTHEMEIPPTEWSVRDGLDPGPVTRVRAIVYWIQNLETGELREPFEEDGRTIVYVGERVTFDATQKGDTSNRPCVWIDDPVWTLCDGTCAFERKFNPHPFHLQLNVVGTGQLDTFVTIDGVQSNDVLLEAR